MLAQRLLDEFLVRVDRARARRWRAAWGVRQRSLHRFRMQPQLGRDRPQLPVFGVVKLANPGDQAGVDHVSLPQGRPSRPATHHAGRTRVVKRATATSPHTSCRHVRCADRLIEGRHLHRPRGTRICHELLSPAPSVLALTIRVVPTGLPALLITPVHFAPPTPLALQPTRHAAIGMAAVARAADVEQTPTSAVTAKTLSENDFPTARAHSTVLSLDSTPAIVASFKPLVARASFAGGGPPKTPVALDDRGFFFARTISRKRVARLTARMMTGPAQLDGWSENCGFTGSATARTESGRHRRDLDQEEAHLPDRRE